MTDPLLPSPAALRELDALYRGLPSGFETPRAERDALDAAVHADAATYGEISDAGAARLLGWMRPDEGDVLYDLGAGSGRLCLRALLATPVGRVVGVELSPHRHGIAVRARRRLAELPGGSVRAGALELRLEDLRRSRLDDATLVYCGSTCFDASVLDAVAGSLRRAPRLRRVVTLRPFGPAARGHLEEVGSVSLPMSWAPRIPAHVYAPHRPSGIPRRAPAEVTPVAAPKRRSVGGSGVPELE